MADSEQLDPPNDTDLMRAAEELEGVSEWYANHEQPELAKSLAKVARLCRELIPALQQYGPIIEQWMRSTGQVSE